MSGLILRRRQPKHARTSTPPRRPEPGRSLREYADARTLGVSLPTRHPAWLAEVRRQWQEHQAG